MMLPLQANATADFSQDTWWIWLIKSVFILLFLLLSVLMALWVERRVLGRMQTRPGPNVHGPFGLLQSVWDALKLVLKEDFWLKGADKIIYLIAPGIAAFCSFLVYGVLPFGPEVSMFGHVTPLQLTDMPVAVLYILAVTSVGIYGIVLGGWSANSTYPLLGAVRSSAQMISYELAMGLSFVSVFIVAGSMSTSQIVSSQTQLWWAISLFPAFLLFLVSMTGEVNRLPFDLPEAEGELIAGHMVEYSSMKFAWFFLAEYINMFNVSGVAVTLFLGGWHAPWPLTWIGDITGWEPNAGWWPMLWFIAKVWFVMFLLIWTRGTLLRFRYDQFMKLGWKVMIPAGLVWVVMVALVQGVRQFTDTSLTTLLIWIGGVFLVLMVLLLLWPSPKQREPEIEEPRDFDAFAGGYPVPPMPGQTLPPSPRRRRREAAMAMNAQEATDE